VLGSSVHRPQLRQSGPLHVSAHPSSLSPPAGMVPRPGTYRKPHSSKTARAPSASSSVRGILVSTTLSAARNPMPTTACSSHEMETACTFIAHSCGALRMPDVNDWPFLLRIVVTGSMVRLVAVSISHRLRTTLPSCIHPIPSLSACDAPQPAPLRKQSTRRNSRFFASR
jgi:hypothetical protein